MITCWEKWCILGTASDTQEVVISLFLIYSQKKHRELTTHAPGDQQNHDAKKLIKHVLNCETVAKPQRLRLRQQPESTHCEGASVFLPVWLINDQLTLIQRHLTHMHRRTDEQDDGISPETAHLQETNHHTAKKEFKERRIISEKSLIYITILSSH